ncbi:MAG: CARDB domain-containing protein [Gaiellaceae bacterium]
MRPRNCGRCGSVALLVVFGLVAAALLGPGTTQAAQVPKAVQITKTADAGTANAGDQIGYTITVSNLAKPPASDVLVTDTLPANSGTSWSISSAPPGACAISSGVLRCFVSHMPSGFSVHIVSPTTAATCGTVSNTASVTTKKNGGATSQTATITVNCPDLTITSIAYPNNDLSACTVTVKNIGTGTANLSGVVVQGYYEPDTTYNSTTGDPAGGTTFSQPTLAPGASVDVTICTGSAPAGDKYLVVKVDATDALAESDETNNVAYKALPAPDLTITSIAYPNGDLSACTVTVKNIGTGTANLSGVVVQGYYEPDTTYNSTTGDPAGGASFSQPTLAPGASADVTICNGSAPPIDHYLVVKVDATDVLPESNENNNVGYAPLPGPDLTITSIDYPNGDLSACVVTVKNIGTTTADLTGVIVQGYYEPDTAYNPITGDPAGGSTFSQGTLAPGATAQVTICTGSAPSTDHYLVVKVDALNVLAESNEDNNVAYKPLP